LLRSLPSANIPPTFSTTIGASRGLPGWYLRGRAYDDPPLSPALPMRATEVAGRRLSWRLI
jgi:hypothetical protein